MRREPVSRRDRPAKPALSRDGIVDAALAVVTAEGLEKLTMRRLAVELDTAPASLYVYVKSNTELHALILGRLLARLDVRWSGRGDWRGRLRRLLVDYVDLLMEQPALARAALVTWPTGPAYLDLLDLVVRLLVAGGVPDSRAAWGVDALLQQATAMAAEYANRDADDGEALADLGAELEAADPRRHAALLRLGAGQLAGGDPTARRDWAIDALVAGIVATPRDGE
ncbi:MAG: TetR/AcrR family transcriptional regulator [Motilibacteraceae bacterium]